MVTNCTIFEYFFSLFYFILFIWYLRFLRFCTKKSEVNVQFGYFEVNLDENWQDVRLHHLRQILSIRSVILLSSKLMFITLSSNLNCVFALLSPTFLFWQEKEKILLRNKQHDGEKNRYIYIYEKWTDAQFFGLRAKVV